MERERLFISINGVFLVIRLYGMDTLFCKFSDNTGLKSLIGEGKYQIIHLGKIKLVTVIFYPLQLFKIDFYVAFL
ncbi:hypothetical protein BG74_09325 [Sodalis-like endosymbiont of Proechinophthirus fluctus]|nr:hypothetical protein BG74_09325 [Sodalis-like endosymbiont of Proechinophthirus fluctus]